MLSNNNSKQRTLPDIVQLSVFLLNPRKKKLSSGRQNKQHNGLLLSPTDVCTCPSAWTIFYNLRHRKRNEKAASSFAGAFQRPHEKVYNDQTLRMAVSTSNVGKGIKKGLGRCSLVLSKTRRKIFTVMPPPEWLRYYYSQAVHIPDENVYNVQTIPTALRTLDVGKEIKKKVWVIDILCRGNLRRKCSQ